MTLACHSAPGTVAHSKSKQLFFSPLELDDAGVSVIEYTLQSGTSHETWQRKQRADRLGIFHSVSLSEKWTAFQHLMKPGYLFHTMSYTVFRQNLPTRIRVDPEIKNPRQDYRIEETNCHSDLAKLESLSRKS